MGEDEKLARLRSIVKELGSVVVAYSGGVDSTYLLSVCIEVLKPQNVLAVIADSESYPRRELEEAQAVAKHLGATYQVIKTNELDNPQFARNLPDRCYHCKRELMTRLWEIARERGLRHVIHGANADDLGDYRPGIEAARESGARAPLSEVGLTKADIRALSKQRGLPTWNKPAMACLASRFPYGTPLTAEALRRVEAAEEFLRCEFGLGQVRVRHHDAIARLEVEPQAIPLLAAEGNRQRVVQRLRELGYIYVALDLGAFKSGSMNDVLNR
ncbi:MAG: ATP-dependent sacrificial sulfur transferase LarE [Chloroflexi bacterium]|nr:ATP-dependent sacrificial sulfur transferase LarE [Chloroflexota bacterium]